MDLLREVVKSRMCLDLKPACAGKVQVEEVGMFQSCCVASMRRQAQNSGIDLDMGEASVRQLLHGAKRGPIGAQMMMESATTSACTASPAALGAAAFWHESGDVGGGAAGKIRSKAVWKLFPTQEMLLGLGPVILCFIRVDLVSMLQECDY